MCASVRECRKKEEESEERGWEGEGVGGWEGEQERKEKLDA